MGVLHIVWTSLLAQLLNLQCRTPGFDTWVGKIPWRRESLPTPVFWPGEFHGIYSPWGCKESDTTEQLSLSLFRYADDTSLMAESEEELKSLFIKAKEGSEKNWLKTQHSKN